MGFLYRVGEAAKKDSETDFNKKNKSPPPIFKLKEPFFLFFGKYCKKPVKTLTLNVHMSINFLK